MRLLSVRVYHSNHDSVIIISIFHENINYSRSHLKLIQTQEVPPLRKTPGKTHTQIYPRSAFNIFIFNLAELTLQKLRLYPKYSVSKGKD